MQLIQRPITDCEISSTPVVRQPTHRGLYAQWEIVNGKLVCRWLKNPD